MKAEQIFAFKTTSAGQVLLINKDIIENDVLQIDDAISCAILYPYSRQIIFSKTYYEAASLCETMYTKMSTKKLKQIMMTSWRMFCEITLNNGSRIEFRYRDGDRFWLKYCASEYNIARFVEVTDFTELQVKFMASRIRRYKDNIPIQLKLTSVHYNRQRDYIKNMFFDALQDSNNIVERDKWYSSIVIVGEEDM